ncbi:LOW QUALITY PROTEIN: hypothetical protein HID58_034231 [Brassica napus]|uniref:Rubisco LSMT substrate-binding domain-containing protein n=1 Tax=Brassica napus TaxID=3708 RepID=A0ABQ8C1G8_BRANA|nr:LOW QUALITY PROTEIN: hypothetical protein HID58_034231 [Brassica napus]
MLLCAPRVKLLVFQQRRTLTSSLAKRFSFNAQPLRASQAQIALISYLEQIAGAKLTNTLSIGKSVYGRALFASKVIHAGDCILKVPFNAQITPDELPADIRVSLTDKVGNIGKLAALLMIEINAGQNSRWFPYISRLPQLSDMHSAIFWDENEFSMIRCSAVHKESVKQKARIEKEFSLVSQAFKEHLPKAIERPALENFIGITCLGNLERHITDFMNHDGLSASIVLTDEDNQLSEVLIRYGEFSNATLMLDFGFTLPYNTHDEVQIQMDIPNDDPLRNMNLGLLQTHYTRSGSEISYRERNSSVSPSILHVFSLVPLLKLNDLSKEAEQNDGRLARLPFKDRSRELEAHKIILAHINSLIVDHSVCIKELGASNFRFESQRLTMARELIFGELRVLRSAAEWLIHYCTNLFSAP